MGHSSVSALVVTMIRDSSLLTRLLLCRCLGSVHWLGLGLGEIFGFLLRLCNRAPPPHLLRAFLRCHLRPVTSDAAGAAVLNTLFLLLQPPVCTLRFLLRINCVFRCVVACPALALRLADCLACRQAQPPPTV